MAYNINPINDVISWNQLLLEALL